MKIALRIVVVSSCVAVFVAEATAQQPSANQPTLAPARSTVQLKRTITPGEPTAAPSASAPTAAPAYDALPRPDAQPTFTPTAESSSERHVPLSLGTLSPTPEMWFYERMRQDYDNPQLQVRRRAEQAAAERKAIIASQHWYGYSAARPTAHVTPFTYHYSPMWTGNTRSPYFWAARPTTPIVVQSARPYVGVSGFGAW